jgi:hypothetical protein
MPELHQLLKDNHWMAKLSYMTDIFEPLNELNKKMQGRNENILTCSNKLEGFKNKLELWQRELKQGSLQMYQWTYQTTIENMLWIWLKKI